MVIKIEPFKVSKANEISAMIKTVYDEFVAPDYQDKGNQFFYEWISPEKIIERQSKDKNILIANAEDNVVGMIEIRDNKNISLLFVDKAYQGQGIARKLFNRALEDCVRKDSQLDDFYVHASPFSIPVYEKLGFTSVGKMQEEHGIKYLPMEMKLK